MRNSIIYFSGIFFAIVLFGSCQKDVDIFLPRPPDIVTPTVPEIKGNIDNFFAAIAEDESLVESSHECFCWEFQKLIELPSGNLIVLNGDDFNYPTDCSTIPAIITVKEIDTKGEIILYGRHTISDGVLLESRVEYKIDISYNGVPLDLKPGRNIRILINDDQPRDQMELFYGTDQEGENFNWSQADGTRDEWNNVQGTEWFFQDSSNQISGFGYECFPDSLVWINVDIFKDVDEEDKTSACAMLPDSFSNVNTVMFLVFNDFNGVVGMYGDSASMQFCEPYGSVPIGFDVTFVSISELGEDCYYLGTANATITENHIETIIPEKMTLEEIKAFILGL